MSFHKEISRIVKRYDSRIEIVHRHNTEVMQLEGKKYFYMITVSNIRGNLYKQVILIIAIRKILTQFFKDFFRKYKKKFRYLTVPEISLKKNNQSISLHIHFYLYEDELFDYISPFDEQGNKKTFQQIQMEKQQEEIKLLNRLQAKLSKFLSNFSIHLKKFSIDEWTKKNNYSSLKHNLRHKIKGGRGVIYILFAVIKLFGRNLFITHSRLPISFSELRQYMRVWLFYLSKKPIKYFQLFNNILYSTKWKLKFIIEMLFYKSLFVYYL
jgi:hypothetical protein